MTAAEAIRKAALVLFVLGVLAVASVSLLPQQALPPVGLWDKLQHLVAYGALALTGGAAFPGNRRLLVLGGGLILFGGALELAQAGIPGRFGSIGDALANALGVALGLAVAHWAAHFAARFGRQA